MRVGFCSLLLLTLTACGGGGGGGGLTGRATSGFDEVLRWNAVALEAVVVDHTPPSPSLPGSDVPGAGLGRHGGPTRTARALAMIHAAIYDALNSILRTRTPYASSLVAPDTASVSAAVAQGARDMLVYLYPEQAASFDAALQQDLAAIPDGDSEAQGRSVGSLACLDVAAERLFDGSAGEYPDNAPYTPGMQPGRHRTDPLNPGQGFLTPTWGYVLPFGISTPLAYQPPPPPALASPEYATAFNEVKALGGDGVVTPTTRTAEQTEIGIFWGYDGTPGLGPPPRLYNQIARVIALQQGNDEAENARLFLLLNAAMADAGVAAWFCKYVDSLWRPVVAIREADPGTGPTGLGDGNPATAGDASWTPMGAPSTNSDAPNFTPPFPAYTSGHATFGAACFQMLANFYGTDAISFTVVSDEFNGVNRENATGPPRPLKTRSFTSLRSAAEENGRSRVYLGIHWEFDNQLGQMQGRGIANEVFDRIAN